MLSFIWTVREKSESVQPISKMKIVQAEFQHFWIIESRFVHYSNLQGIIMQILDTGSFNRDKNVNLTDILRFSSTLNCILLTDIKYMLFISLYT